MTISMTNATTDARRSLGLLRSPDQSQKQTMVVTTSTHAELRSNSMRTFEVTPPADRALNLRELLALCAVAIAGNPEVPEICSFSGLLRLGVRSYQN